MHQFDSAEKVAASVGFASSESPDIPSVAAERAAGIEPGVDLDNQDFDLEIQSVEAESLESRSHCTQSDLVEAAAAGIPSLEAGMLAAADTQFAVVERPVAVDPVDILAGNPAEIPAEDADSHLDHLY